MLEKPTLTDERIIACLKESFGIQAERLVFLPLGNDSHAWVYKVCTNTEDYFLKVRKGEIYEPSLAVPRYLREQGIKEILALQKTKQQQLFVRIDDFALILYPFVEGATAMETGMSDDQWRQLGFALRRIHASKLPPELLEQVKTETFIPGGMEFVRTIQAIISKTPFDNALEYELSQFWKEKEIEIKRILNRTEALGEQLKARSPENVLCHTDIHTANILLDSSERMFIVDWDNPLLAPKERDLMFVVGKEDERLFFQGYGEVEIDKIALAYYRYEWVVQEIGDYGKRVLLDKSIGSATKADAVKSFIALFAPGDVVELAYQADPAG